MSPLDSYRASATRSGLPSRSRRPKRVRAVRAGGPAPSRSSSSKSTTPGRCTGTSASSATACSSRGRCPKGLPAGPGPQPPRRPRRGPPPRVRDLRGHDPRRRVRRGRGDASGTAAPTSATKWTEREVMVILARRAGRGPLRPVPDRRRQVDDPPHGSGPGGWEPLPELGPPRCWPRSAERCRPTTAWAYEFKWDGVRAVVYVDGGRVRTAVEDRPGRDRLLPRAAGPGRGARDRCRRSSTARSWPSTSRAGRASRPCSRG